MRRRRIGYRRWRRLRRFAFLRKENLFDKILRLEHFHWIILTTEALSSDEDEVDENNTSYLDNIKNFATKKASLGGFEMSAEIKVKLIWQKTLFFSLTKRNDVFCFA